MALMRRKEYAHSLGLATLGKGRMSREALAAIETARAGGMKFADDPDVIVSTRTEKKPAKPAKVIVKAESKPALPVERADNYGPAFVRFPMDQKFSYEHPDTGKRVIVNGRGVCRECGYSLIGHGCATHVILTAHGWQGVTPVGE